MDKLRLSLKILIPVVIIGAVLYQYRAEISSRILPVWDNIISQNKFNL